MAGDYKVEEETDEAGGQLRHCIGEGQGVGGDSVREGGGGLRQWLMRWLDSCNITLRTQVKGSVREGGGRRLRRRLVRWLGSCNIASRTQVKGSVREGGRRGLRQWPTGWLGSCGTA